MSIWDLDATTDAMATALAGVTPPSGETLRKAYPKAPNNTPVTPCGVFLPQSGEMVLEPSGYQGDHLIDLWFLIDRSSGDFPRHEERRQKWLPVLLHAFDSAMALGLAPVVRKAYPVGWEFDTLTYGAVEYDGIKVHYHVATEEFVSLAA